MLEINMKYNQITRYKWIFRGWFKVHFPRLPNKWQLNLIEKRIKRGSGEYIIGRNVETNIAFSCLTAVLALWQLLRLGGWGFHVENLYILLWGMFEVGRIVVLWEGMPCKRTVYSLCLYVFWEVPEE